MKRFLSLLLAMALIVAMMPVSSAEEGDAAGITLVYDLNGVTVALKDKGATLKGADSFFGKGYKAYTYDETNGFFEYAANKSRDKYSWNSDGYDYPASIGGRQVAEAKAGTTGASGIQMLSYYRQSEGLLNNWFAIRINVPKSGAYTPKASYWQFNKGGETYLDYYLIKDTGEELSVALDEERLAPTSEYYIGSKFCNNTTIGSAAQKIVLNEAFDKTLTLEEGIYYLVYKPRVAVVADDYIGNYAVASTFTLDGGNTADPVPMKATLSCDSARVFDGGNTAQLTAHLFMSDKTKKLATDVKFKALTPEYATVDENTGLITGVAPGQAEFEAIATENGKEYKATYSITVSDNRLSGITVKYDLSSLIKAYADEGAAIHGADSFFGDGYNAFTYDKTNGFFKYAANKTKDIYSWADNGYNHSVTITRDVTKIRSLGSIYGLQFLSQYVTKEGLFNSWFALKINVPVSGVYTPRVTYAKYNKDGETYIDYFLIKDDGSDMTELLAETNLTPESEGYIGSKACEETN